MIKEDQFYSPSEIAKLLRVSPATVLREIRGGKLKALRIAGQWRVLGSELALYVAGATQTALRNKTDAAEIREALRLPPVSEGDLTTRT